jgi:hypothetical protein
MGAAVNVIAFPTEVAYMREKAKDIRHRGGVLLKSSSAVRRRDGIDLLDFADLLEHHADRTLKECIM